MSVHAARSAAAARTATTELRSAHHAPVLLGAVFAVFLSLATAHTLWPPDASLWPAACRARSRRRSPQQRRQQQQQPRAAQQRAMARARRSLLTTSILGSCWPVSPTCSLSGVRCELITSLHPSPVRDVCQPTSWPDKPLTDNRRLAPSASRSPSRRRGSSTCTRKATASSAKVRAASQDEV